MDNYGEKIYIKRKKRSSKTASEIYQENFERWVGYWRANIHRFITEYLGIGLYDFQKVLIWMFDMRPYSIEIASRGLNSWTLI